MITLTLDKFNLIMALQGSKTVSEALARLSLSDLTALQSRTGKAIEVKQQNERAASLIEANHAEQLKLDEQARQKFKE